MSTVLERIVASKRGEVAESKRARPQGELLARLPDAPPVRDFAAALAAPGPIKVIAEIKRASPSAGLIRRDFDPVRTAATYQRSGAAAISVLTDGPFFQGSLEHLTAVRAAVSLPVLRKDFLIDPYQVLEARVHGADAVLLIAEILSDQELDRLLDETGRLGMSALVELHDCDNLERVLRCGARIVGVNNRDLRTFQTDLSRTLELAARIVPDRLLVSESGIHSHADIRRLQAAGACAVLVGESLMRAADPGLKLRQLLGR